jgi:hypothetical protein
MSNVSSPLLLRGILTLVVGVVAVASPGITIGAFAVLFAVWSLSSAPAPASQRRPTEEAAPWTQPPA